jgi:pimeloyl-ACP methyl ester carboxylesterase
MNNLVKKFCTPPYKEITKFDLESLETAEKTEIDFEEMQLPLYSWGKGEKVLLVHGWGSRASHMSLMARIIAKAGFNVFIFDAPAHSSFTNIPPETTSNMFQFGRSISAVAKHLGDIHAVAAHSLGAISALFTVTGFGRLKEYKFVSKKVVLINSPSSVESIISWFSKKHNLTEDEKNKLWLGLEEEFEFAVSDYCVSNALKKFKTDLMVIHDEDDEEISVSNASDFRKALPQALFHFTKGLGHAKILFDRETIKAVLNFIKENEK